MNKSKHFIFSRNIQTVFSILSIILVFNSCDETPKTTIKTETVTPPESTVAEIPYSVLTTSPHDVSSFTEGFLFHNGQLFESTGATAEFPQTKSLFGIVDVKTGKIDMKAELDKSVYFGEGIVVLKNKIYQVTYKNQIGFIYDAATYKKIGQLLNHPIAFLLSYLFLIAANNRLHYLVIKYHHLLYSRIYKH